MWWASLVLGLASTSHCAAMCSSICAAACHRSQPDARPWLALLTGRCLAYATLGALAGGLYESLYWLSGQASALRPWWTLLHAAVLVYGLTVLATARHPALIGRVATAWVGRWRGEGVLPIAFGAALGAMPCAMLYSALVLASLSGTAWEGAAAMILFALGSSVGLFGGPWLLARLRLAASPSRARLATRVAGLSLAVSGAWALSTGYRSQILAWCT